MLRNIRKSILLNLKKYPKLYTSLYIHHKIKYYQELNYHCLHSNEDFILMVQYD